MLLSFFPFCNVMLSICRTVLHWRAAEDAIYLALNDYFPGEMAGFLRRNLAIQGHLQITSMVLLLFTANGIFEPLEVALNRAWGVTKNRSYLMNQLVALGMIFLCGALALASLMLTAMNKQWMASWAGSLGGVQTWLNLFLFKVAAVPLSILALFLIYWLLPNRKVEPAHTMFSAFHHFRPDAAKAILKDAFDRRRTICIFESGFDTLLAVGAMIGVPVAVLALMPFARPFRWAYLAFTYLIPLMPLIVLWDGIVSSLRIYSPDQMKKLTDDLRAPDYAWEIGRIRVPGIPSGPPYLIGRPRLRS